jgi:hypothetical protein
MEANYRSPEEITMTNHAVLLSADFSRANAKSAADSVSPTEATVAAAPVAPATSSIIAGLLMASGIGWNAGLEAQPFHPLMVGISALAVHVLPLIAVVFVFVRAWRGASRGRGVTIAAVLAVAFGVFSGVFSMTHPHAQMGIHDVNDILPIAILVAGALLWLVRGRRTLRANCPGE